MASAFDAVDQTAEQDALDSITRMMVGTKMLRSEPGVVYSLAAAQAHPQEAQAVDQFMQSLDAEKQVNIARASGTFINLSNDQQKLLRQNNVAFNDVQFTSQSAAQTITQQVMAATGGQATPKLNSDGSLALDSSGQIQLQETHHSDGGWFSSFGSFFGHLGGAIKGGFGDVLHGLNLGYNFVESTISKGTRDFIYEVSHPGKVFDTSKGAGERLRAAADPTNDQDMRANGYDPNSFWSSMAYLSSGHAHTDLSSLNDKYGEDKVTEAIQFLNDPSKYRQQIESDPTNFITTPDGQTALTPDAKAKLTYLQSPEFVDLAKQINAHSATVGNDLMNTLGVDPVNHSTLYTVGAAGTNIAASFFIDPSMVALKAVQAAKMTAVGIDTLGDAEKASSILTRSSRLPWINNVQRGWQRGIDLGQKFREASTDAERAAITAQFRAELPALEPIWENFTGGDRVYQGLRAATDAEKAAGVTSAQPIMGPSSGFRTLEDAADFIRSRSGLTRLYSGRAAVQSSLMPGALSAFGYRKLKGITAAWMTTRSADRASKAYEAVLSRAEADPELAKKLIDEKMLVRLLPQADDAVLTDGTTLAETAADPTLLPSQARSLALTAAGKGEITSNLRATGDALGESTLGRFAPAAVAARARLAAQRLSTLLPRTTAIDINDARSGDTIYKFALTYLNRGDANTLRAMWNVADGGQRKAIVSGLLDQVGHAAGFSKTASGQKILDLLKSEQSYSAAGSEIELLGDRIALVDGQTRTAWHLPSFYDMQKNAAKLGLWESTFGRALTSQQADSLMGAWKMGALFKPSTFTRNQLEGWLRTVLEGRAGDAIKARAFLTTPFKELWDRGYGLVDRETYMAARGQAETLAAELKAPDLPAALRAEKQDALREAKRRMEAVSASPVVGHLLATEAGDATLAGQIERASMLSGSHLGRAKYGTKLAEWAPVALAGRAYRTMVGKFMDEETLNAMLTLGRDDLSAALAGYREQVLATDLGFRHAAKEATDIAADGFGPATIRGFWHKAMDRAAKPARGETDHTVWTNKALDGTLGVDRYAAALGRLVNKTPETARAVLAYIEDPSLGIDHVVNALEKEKGLTAFGSVFFPDPIANPNVARRAINADEVFTGKRDWARKLVDEYTYMLTGRNGEFQIPLSDYIREHGMAPQGDWVADNLIGDARPATALAPETMAMPNGGEKSIPQALQDLAGGAYEWMVERPLQRTTTSPVFLANYAIARKGLNREVERLVKNGIDREAADGLAKELSIRNAWVKSEQMIDDPGQKTQFDVISRNMFPFARATQAMVRRWGTGLWQNPAAARKMMLSYEGAVHSGLIYNNAYGEPTFTYPGSGAFGQVMHALNGVPGFNGIAAFPVAGDMTGQVLMSVPGADNPLRMGMGPMISIPLREVYKHLLPTSWRGDARAVDEFINGPIGVGQTWSSLVPTAARRFFNAFSQDQRNSALASSMNGAIANLAAAGLIPPPDASPAELQLFRSRVQTQTRNQLFVRFALGLFAPASPSTPTESIAGVTGADYAWQLDGVKQLSDEYRLILNETGGDLGRANAIFTALHPDEVVYKDGHAVSQKMPASAYENARSESTTKGAYLPATDASLKWLDTHDGFVKRYKSVAAYFIPSSSSGEPFSDAAYQAELELGLRLRKTPQEFMNDIYVKHAEDLFYPTVDQYDRRINQAKAAGDDALVSALTDQKSQWEKDYKSLNPLFGQKLEEYGPARATALGQLSDLRVMLRDGDVPDGLAPTLQKLVTAWDNYEKFVGQYPGSDTNSNNVRSQAINTLNAWATQTLAGTPLTAVWNGLFRTLNTNLVLIPGGS